MRRRHVLAGLATTATGPALVGGARAGAEAVIGLSNGYIGNEWRNQMVASAQLQFEGYKERGMAFRLEVLHAGADVDQQVRDLRDMIRQNVAVITLNPNSATGLNGAINEAKRANIPVVAFDRTVTNPYALNITVDHYTW